MKKIVLFFVIVSVVLLGTGCSKEKDNVLQKSTGNVLPGSGHLKQAEGNVTLMYVWTYYYDPSCSCWKWEPIDIDCYPPPTNCAPTVTIYGYSDKPTQKVLDEFDSAYNQNKIPYFFTNSNYQLLFPQIDSMNGIVDSIKYSQLKITRFYQASDSVNFYFCLPPSMNLTDDWKAAAARVTFAMRIKDKRK
jgi:hypothetical protein